MIELKHEYGNVDLRVRSENANTLKQAVADLMVLSAVGGVVFTMDRFCAEQDSWVLAVEVKIANASLRFRYIKVCSTDDTEDYFKLSATECFDQVKHSLHAALCDWLSAASQ